MDALSPSQFHTGMMNIEQGMSNHELGSLNSSLRHWKFDIRNSAVRSSTASQIAEKSQSKKG
jgi:hypothetical protein